MLLICPPVGKNFENSISEMAENAFNLSTMVGENFENSISEIAVNAFNLYTMVGEKFGNSISEMAGNAFQGFYVSRGCQKLKQL